MGLERALFGGYIFFEHKFNFFVIPWSGKLLEPKNNSAKTWKAERRPTIPSVYVGSITFVLVSFSSDFCDMSKFIEK